MPCATMPSSPPDGRTIRNRVNNVLLLFIFRGALDVGATEINETMKRACAEAIARMARAEAFDVVLAAYGADNLRFRPDYIISQAVRSRG